MGAAWEMHAMCESALRACRITCRTLARVCVFRNDSIKNKPMS